MRTVHLKLVRRLALVAACFLISAPNLTAADGPYGVTLQANVMVPMRDGVPLATDVYLPTKDGTPLAERLPTVL